MNKVLICGFGHVGYQIFALLRRLNISGTIITNENKAERTEEAEQAGFKVIVGDASDIVVLKKAGAESCGVLFAVTDSDLTNLSILSDLQKFNSKARLVVRLFDKLLSEQLVKTKLAHSILSTTEIAAPLFLKTILNAESGVVCAINRFEDKILIVKEDLKGALTLEVNDPPRSQRALLPTKGFLRVLSKGVLKARSFLFMLLLLTTAGMLLGLLGLNLSVADSFYFFVTTVTTTGYGDINFFNSSAGTKILGSFFILWGAVSVAILFSLLTDTLLRHRLQSLIPTSSLPDKNHILLIGANRLSHRLYTILNTLGIPSIIIKTIEDQQAQLNLPQGASIINGDPRDSQLLESLNIKQARGVVSCTGDDVVNLGSCVLAKKLNSQIITVSRIYDSFLTSKLQSTLNIDDTGSISAYAASYFVAHALRTNVVAAFEKNDKLVVICSSESEPIKNFHLAAAANANIAAAGLNFKIESYPLSK